MAATQLQSRLMITTGIIFMALSFAPIEGRAVWLPIGVVFLVLGLRKRREANPKTPPTGTGPV